MVAKVSTATVAQFKLSGDEAEVLDAAYELIDVIHSTVERGGTIVSKETGECITWEERARVKGVRSGIIDNSGAEWNVQEE